MKRVIVLLGSGLVILAGCSDSNIADVGVAKAANGGHTIHVSLAGSNFSTSDEDGAPTPVDGQPLVAIQNGIAKGISVLQAEIHAVARVLRRTRGIRTKRSRSVDVVATTLSTLYGASSPASIRTSSISSKVVSFRCWTVQKFLSGSTSMTGLAWSPRVSSR